MFNSFVKLEILYEWDLCDNVIASVALSGMNSSIQVSPCLAA